MSNLLKTALQKELGPDARLVYSIRMENRFGNNNRFYRKYSELKPLWITPQQVDAPLHSQSAELKNPFVIPGIKNLAD